MTKIPTVYSAYGTSSGHCGHRHETLAEAIDCARSYTASLIGPDGFQRQGTYVDKTIVSSACELWVQSDHDHFIKVGSRCVAGHSISAERKRLDDAQYTALAYDFSGPSMFEDYDMTDWS